MYNVNKIIRVVNRRNNKEVSVVVCILVIRKNRENKFYSNKGEKT